MAEAESVEIFLTKALESLTGDVKSTIQARYPEASFEIGPAIEDPGGVELLVTLNIDDLDDVTDLVIDRVLELQLEHDIWIYVLPVWPLQRTLEEMRRPRTPPQLDIDLITPLMTSS